MSTRLRAMYGNLCLKPVGVCITTMIRATPGHYHLKDYLGTPRVTFTDVDNDEQITQADVLEQKRTYPFGMFAFGFRASGYDPDRLDFTGHQVVGSTTDRYHATMDMQARYYSPGMASFVGVDPLASEMPSYSPYVYGFNNPIGFTDPTGRAPQDIIIKSRRGGNSDKYRARVLSNLQSLTNDKLAINRKGKVRIVSRGSGSKSSGTALVRGLIGSSRVVTITDEASRTTTSSGQPLDLTKQSLTTPKSESASANGSGTDSQIQYSPDVKAKYTDSNGDRKTSSANMVLGHELDHAEANAEGENLGGNAPSDPRFKNAEEERAVGRENQLRSENGQPTRDN